LVAQSFGFLEYHHGNQHPNWGVRRAVVATIQGLEQIFIDPGSNLLVEPVMPCVFIVVHFQGFTRK